MEKTRPRCHPGQLTLAGNGICATWRRIASDPGGHGISHGELVDRGAVSPICWMAQHQPRAIRALCAPERHGIVFIRDRMILSAPNGDGTFALASKKYGRIGRPLLLPAKSAVNSAFVRLYRRS